MVTCSKLSNVPGQRARSRFLGVVIIVRHRIRPGRNDKPGRTVGTHSYDGRNAPGRFLGEKLYVVKVLRFLFVNRTTLFDNQPVSHLRTGIDHDSLRL